MDPCKGNPGESRQTVRAPPSQIWKYLMLMCCTESFVDDLRTGQGVVGGRAASSLRSTKTSPSKAGGFVTRPDDVNSSDESL